MAVTDLASDLAVDMQAASSVLIDDTRAVDKFGKTIDFLLSQKRDQQAAKRFFDRGDWPK